MPRPATAPPWAATVLATHMANMKPTTLNVEQTVDGEGRRDGRKREGGRE